MSVKVLNGGNLVDIAAFLMEKGYDKGVTIEISVKDKETLKRVHEDYYYKYNDGTPDDLMADITEFIVNVSGIKFKYVVKSE